MSAAARRGRAVPGLPDLRVRVLRAVHRRHRRSHRPPPHAGHLQQRDLPDVVRLRHDDDVAADAGDRVRARPVLVGPADLRRRLRHRPDARQPPRRRHRLLRHLHDPRRRRRARGRPLGLSARLALALRLHRHIEFDDGDYCDAVGGISTQCRRGREAVAVARSAGVASDDRVADAVPAFVRLRRHHELRGDLCEGARRHAAESVLFGLRGRDGVDAAVFRDACRSHRSGEGAGAVSAADGVWLCAAGDWRIEGHVDCRGARLWHGLRLGVSGVRGVRDASRRGHEARRGVWRHPRGARHGDWLRLDHAGMDHPALRVFGGVFHGGLRGPARAAVVPVHAPARARTSIDRDVTLFAQRRPARSPPA